MSTFYPNGSADFLLGSIRRKELLNAGLDCKVGDKRLVEQNHVGFRAGVVSCKPTLDLSLLVSVSVGTNHRFLHDLQRDGAYEVIRNSNRLGTRRSRFRHCRMR